MDSVTATREVTSSAPARRQAWSAWLDSDEPHPVRGPFSRWPRTSDSVLALAVFIGSLIAVAVSALDDGDDFTFGSIGDLPAAEIILLGLAAAALPWRRRHPIGVTVVVLVIMLGWAVAGYGDGHELASIVAVYSVGRYATDHRHSLATVAAAIAVGIIGTIIDSDQRVDIVPAVVLTALAWYVGRRSAIVVTTSRCSVNGPNASRRSNRPRARQAVADERARIARELHDVVAHRVSMMTVQAGAAKTIARDDLDAAVEAMDDVEHAGRQALGELRHLLGVLRPDTADPDDLGPRPGLADVATLTDELAHTGADVTLTVDGLDDRSTTCRRPSISPPTASCRSRSPTSSNTPDPTPPSTSPSPATTDGSPSTSPTRPAAPHPASPRRASASPACANEPPSSVARLTAGPQLPDTFRVHADLPVDREPT